MKAILFFANYTLTGNIRTTETKLCDSYREAKELVESGEGYVTRQSAEGRNTLKFMTPNFKPSAEEQINIDRILASKPG